MFTSYIVGEMDGIVLILLPSFIKIYVSSVTPDPNMCGMRCCAGYFLHNEICTVCRSGQIGENCSQACPTGFYGELCRNDCPFECKNNCNEVTGRCPLDNNTQNNSIETQIEHFLKKNAWLIGGVTFLLLLILCGSIGFIHLSQALKCFKMNRTNDVTHLTSKKPQSSSSSRHEPDYSNIPSGSIRANCSVKSTLTKQLSNKKEGMQSCEYSKPTTKKRYSFIWRSSVSQEVTLCPGVSEDEEDSEDFGVDAKTTSGVQISGLPQGSVKISGLPQEKSFKTFQSLDEKEETDYGANTAYGNVWE